VQAAKRTLERISINQMWQKTFKNKYGAKKTEYNGRKYASRIEAEDALWLDVLLSDKKIKEVIPQFKIRFEVNGKHLWNHIVDFKVVLNDDRVKMVETKGFATELWRRNVKLFEALYPEIPYLINTNEKQLLS
jgi:hypothetical protein